MLKPSFEKSLSSDVAGFYPEEMNKKINQKVTKSQSGSLQPPVASPRLPTQPLQFCHGARIRTPKSLKEERLPAPGTPANLSNKCKKNGELLYQDTHRNAFGLVLCNKKPTKKHSFGCLVHHSTPWVTRCAPWNSPKASIG